MEKEAKTSFPTAFLFQITLPLDVIFSSIRKEKQLPSPGLLSARIGIFKRAAASAQRYSPRPLAYSGVGNKICRCF